MAGDAISKMFGRTYSNIGSSDSDLLLKTRGQVKIQWANKFIDLVKDGKLNVDVTVVNKVSDINQVSKDGLYVIGDDKTIVLRIDGENIVLTSDSAASYISFINKQTTTDSQKSIALTNIGIRYKDAEEAIAAGITTGIVFLDSTSKFYVVANKVFTEYSASIPDPYTKPFIIKKEDKLIGALVIEGKGITNSILIGSTSNGFLVYRDEGEAIINNKAGGIIIQINSEAVVSISRDDVTIASNVVCNGIIKGNNIESVDANASKGFRLYVKGGKSTLEVDNLVVRNISKEDMLQPITWYRDINKIVSVEDTTVIPNSVILNLALPNTYEIEDVLCTYLMATLADGSSGVIEVALTVKEADSDSVTVVINEPENVQETSLLTGGIIYYVAGSRSVTRIEGNNIDILHVTSAENIHKLTAVSTRVGSIQDIPYIAEGITAAELSAGTEGIFTNNLVAFYPSLVSPNLYKVVFKGGPTSDWFPSLSDDLILPPTDNSQRLVTSKWTNTAIYNSFWTMKMMVDVLSGKVDTLTAELEALKKVVEGLIPETP